MKLVPDSLRLRSKAAPDGMPLSTRELFTVLAQGITVLRIAGLVFVLYMKFKFERMLESWRK